MPTKQHTREVLRKLTGLAINSCFGYKGFHAIALPTTQPSKLSKDRTESTMPFQIVVVDYAEPINYRNWGKQVSKAYIINYACSLTRVVQFELTKTMNVEEFPSTLKRLSSQQCL